MAEKTYKQWYDYHLKLLKKNKQYENASENALKILAGDLAQRSLDEQRKASAAAANTPAGNIASTMSAPTSGTGRVGRDATPAPAITKNPVAAPTPTATAAPKGQVPANANDPNTYNNRMQSRIKALGIQGYTSSNPAPSVSAVEFLATLTDAQYSELAKVLKSLDYSVKEKGRLKDVLLNYFEEIFPVKNYADLLAKLKARAIAGTGAGDENLPERRITQPDRGALIELAQAVAAKGKFELTPEELNAVVDPWMKKLAQGTLTTTQKVRNPKTGKLENVTKTTAAFRQGEEELALEQKLRATKPQQFELAGGIDFADELKKLLAGGM